ncbi:hypothetical protein GW17_00047876 [Ensete ventricosum]|nr:hypothetical protein GW17_00047876 [Ensete ventricosum]
MSQEHSMLNNSGEEAYAARQVPGTKGQSANGALRNLVHLDVLSIPNDPTRASPDVVQSFETLLDFLPREEEYMDHDDALVIAMWIANTWDKRIMVDKGSSIDILYFDIFQKLGLSDGDLLPMTSTLTRFTGDSISPLGITSLGYRRGRAKI